MIDEANWATLFFVNLILWGAAIIGVLAWCVGVCILQLRRSRKEGR